MLVLSKNPRSTPTALETGASSGTGNTHNNSSGDATQQKQSQEVSAHLIQMGAGWGMEEEEEWYAG